MPASEPLRCGFCGSEYTVEGETTQYPVPTAEARLIELANAFRWVSDLEYGAEIDASVKYSEIVEAQSNLHAKLKAIEAAYPRILPRTIRTFKDDASTMGADLP